MKTHTARRLASLLVFAVSIPMGVGIPLAASSQPQQGAKSAAASSQAEEDAYKILNAARSGSPSNQIQLGEDFVKRFPQSRYLADVYAQLTTAYYQEGQDSQTFSSGDMALALDPDNAAVLSLFASVLPHRVKSTTPDAAQQFQKAEAYARRALEVIPKQPKPAWLDAAAFEKMKNEELSMAHSGLGLTDYQHQKFAEARTELTEAVRLALNPDPSDYFVLGDADLQGHNYNDAIAAFAKCAAAGDLVAQCSANLQLAREAAAK